MTLEKFDENGTCSWCSKNLEVVHVTFADKSTAALCWADLKRMAKLKLPANGGQRDQPNLQMNAG